MAKEAGYEVIEINLESELEVLETRFDERVRGSLADSSKKISNTSKDRFKELFEIYNKEKNLLAKTLHTDKQSIEEVVNKIKVYL